MKTVFIFFLIFTTSIWSNEILLTEDFLQSVLKEENPGQDKINLQFQRAVLNYEKNQLNFAPQLYGKYSTFSSNEKSLISAVPTTSKTMGYSLGAKKSIPLGASLAGEYFYEQSSNNYITDAGTNGIGFELSLDLYKNLFGYQDRNLSEKISVNQSKAKIGKSIQNIQFKNSIRKIYWSLVANQESIITTQQLINSAKKQLKVTKLRFKNKVSDAGEVARYHALVSERQSSLISLKYQKDSLLKSLKELLPSLADKNVSLGSYDIDKTIQEVVICSNKINTYSHIPWENTQYDELTKLSSQELHLNKKLTARDNGISVTAFGSYQFLGKGVGRSNAYDDLRNNRQNRQLYGLNFTIPIGGQASKTQKVEEKINKLMANAEIKELTSQLTASHKQIGSTINHLFEALRNRKLNSSYLEKSLAISKRKYRQARITSTQIIQEEDALFQSRLSEIQTNLVVVNTLIDYFSIYSSTPCKFNLNQPVN